MKGYESHYLLHNHYNKSRVFNFLQNVSYCLNYFFIFCLSSIKSSKYFSGYVCVLKYGSWTHLGDVLSRQPFTRCPVIRFRTVSVYNFVTSLFWLILPIRCNRHLQCTRTHLLLGYSLCFQRHTCWFNHKIYLFQCIGYTPSINSIVQTGHTDHSECKASVGEVTRIPGLQFFFFYIQLCTFLSRLVNMTFVNMGECTSCH